MADDTSTKLDRVRVLLRTELFSTGGPDAHLPPNVAIIDGRVKDRQGGLTIEVEGVHDAQGRRLAFEPCTVWLPASKIDHAVVLAS